MSFFFLKNVLQEIQRNAKTKKEALSRERLKKDFGNKEHLVNWNNFLDVLKKKIKKTIKNDSKTMRDKEQQIFADVFVKMIALFWKDNFSSIRTLFNFYSGLGRATSDLDLPVICDFNPNSKNSQHYLKLGDVQQITYLNINTNTNSDTGEKKFFVRKINLSIRNYTAQDTRKSEISVAANNES